ncbi:MAG: hypothetical protein ACE15B_20210 [Bryobacteraceae bacterium]
MKARYGTIPILVLLLGGAAAAEIIDRIAVIVGNRVITESEIEREIRVTAFLNREPPDLSPAARRKAADRLIEQKLVRRELELSRYPQPAPAEVEPLYRGLEVRHGGAAGLRKALENYGFTESALREHLLWQLTLMRFIDVRFRPGISISEQEVQEYYEKHLNGAGNLEQYREKIEQALTNERINQDLDRWLQRARTRNRIEYKEAVFR